MAVDDEKGFVCGWCRPHKEFSSKAGLQSHRRNFHAHQLTAVTDNGHNKGRKVHNGNGNSNAHQPPTKDIEVAMEVAFAHFCGKVEEQINQFAIALGVSPSDATRRVSEFLRSSSRGRVLGFANHVPAMRYNPTV